MAEIMMGRRVIRHSPARLGSKVASMSINEKWAASQPGASKYEGLLGGSGASIVANPDSTFNYKSYDKSIDENPQPTSEEMQILDLIRKKKK